MAHPKNKIDYTNNERVEIFEQIGELEQKVGRGWCVNKL